MIGIILAGGRASRMGGGDKGLHRVGGKPVLDQVVAAMERQCEGLLVSANGDPARLARYGLPVVADDLPDHPGPLAGVLAGLDWIAAHHPACAFAVTVPADAPFLPADLVARLQDVRAEDRAGIVRARSGGASHPTAALWSVALRHDLRRCLAAEGLRKVGAFQDRHPVAHADWPAHPVDPFFNINTPEDLARANDLAGSEGRVGADG